MKVSEITETEFRKMVAVSTRRLNENADFINKLNVFPVPDGDTGTNTSMSLASGAKYVAESAATSVGELTTALAKGLLMGARGNSGVILSQIFRGFNRSVGKKKTLTAQDLADAITNGAETAYKAVMKPTEGTILTVARKAAEAARHTVRQTNDAAQVMQAAAAGAAKALATTPDLLPVLKEVGVVDSGGQALTFVYQAFADALTGNVAVDETHQPTPGEMEGMVSAKHQEAAQTQLNPEDIKYGYCTEIMVRLGAGKLVDKQFDYDEFRGYLNKLGDSLLVIADDEVVKVHVHTEHPGKVLSYGQHFGALIKVKVDNMRLQHETILEENGVEDQPAPQKNEVAGDYGIIAIASGDGIAKMFTGLGVTNVLSGGQTMNPSTADIVAVIKATKADKVIILPNNKNIFMAAEQAAEVVDADVAVVPTKTIAQGMTALLDFNKDLSLAENAKNMAANLDDVKSGQVTVAVRDTTIDGRAIHKGDYMGIVDGTIVVTNTDQKKAAVEMVGHMLDEDSEIVTIIYGEDGSETEAQAIKAAVLTLDDELEVEIHAGDQPVYPYLISVE
ncbi:DAK2 domain-containing protein [Ligilactobacillus sp. LYQ60]|uniref:DAK2 domain-containing protein n=1 Tax=unclassified Ligilactobacillus TaxID=2767920 RepID=UPI003854E841